MARQSFEESLNFAERVGDRRSQAIAYHSLGNLYGQQKLNFDAITYFNKALSLQDEKNNPLGQAITYRRIGDCWRHSALKNSSPQDREHLEKALDSYNHSLGLALKIDDQYNAQMLYARIGETYRLLGDSSGARLAYQQALGLGRVEQHPGGLAEVYIRLAELEFEQGARREGRGLLQAAERELKATSDNRIKNRVHEKIRDLEEGYTKLTKYRPVRSIQSSPYSTVTLLARLRGWSTSVPLMTAV
jgi:tetratricopeptide (TPR) repeat protein